MSEEKQNQERKKDDARDLEPKKDAKGGGGFPNPNNPQPAGGGGGTSTQPVNPPGS